METKERIKRMEIEHCIDSTTDGMDKEGEREEGEEKKEGQKGEGRGEKGDGPVRRQKGIQRSFWRIENERR